MEQIIFKINLGKFQKDLKTLNCIGIFNPKTDVREVYGRFETKINVSNGSVVRELKKSQVRVQMKNSKLFGFLKRLLDNVTSLEVDFKKSGMNCVGFLRLENQQLFLTESNLYQEVEPEQIQIYNTKNRIGRNLCQTFEINKRYLLISDDFSLLDNGEYFIVFRSGFYRCLKLENQILFSEKDKRKKKS